MGKVLIILYSVELYGGMDLTITTAFEHSKINIYLKFTVTNTCMLKSIALVALTQQDEVTQHEGVIQQGYNVFALQS